MAGLARRGGRAGWHHDAAEVRHAASGECPRRAPETEGGEGGSGRAQRLAPDGRRRRDVNDRVPARWQTPAKCGANADCRLCTACEPAPAAERPLPPPDEAWRDTDRVLDR